MHGTGLMLLGQSTNLVPIERAERRGEAVVLYLYIYHYLKPWGMMERGVPGVAITMQRENVRAADMYMG